MSRRILKVPFRISDLKFGNEAVERDELPDESYVQRPTAKTILAQERTIVVGDRGSGKSAILRKLAEDDAVHADEHARAEVCPVTNTADLLHKIVADDKAWLDTDALRAAWLAVVAATAAIRRSMWTTWNIRAEAAFGLSGTAVAVLINHTSKGPDRKPLSKTSHRGWPH